MGSSEPGAARLELDPGVLSTAHSGLHPRSLCRGDAAATVLLAAHVEHKYLPGTGHDPIHSAIRELYIHTRAARTDAVLPHLSSRYILLLSEYCPDLRPEARQYQQLPIPGCVLISIPVAHTKGGC